VVQILPMDTCYSPGFTNAKYLGVTAGDRPVAVRARIGEPFEIWWDLDDRVVGDYVSFERRNGRWVSHSAHGVPVADGTPMTALDALRGRVVEEGWVYSRPCVPEVSWRIRTVTFRGGRVAVRFASAYHD
jgi:hypothetical protein